MIFSRTASSSSTPRLWIWSMITATINFFSQFWFWLRAATSLFHCFSRSLAMIFERERDDSHLSWSVATQMVDTVTKMSKKWMRCNKFISWIHIGRCTRYSITALLEEWIAFKYYLQSMQSVPICNISLITIYLITFLKNEWSRNSANKTTSNKIWFKIHLIQSVQRCDLLSKNVNNRQLL